MFGTIVGFKTVNYTNKDGEAVSGVNLCLTFEDAEVFGKNVKEIFIGSDKPLYSQFRKYFNGEVDSDKLIDIPAEWDYVVENRGGKTFARLASFKLLPGAVKDVAS